MSTCSGNSAARAFAQLALATTSLVDVMDGMIVIGKLARLRSLEVDVKDGMVKTLARTARLQVLL